MSAELKMLQKMEKDAKLMEDTIQKKQKQCEQIDQTGMFMILNIFFFLKLLNLYRYI